jgi:hypothetical protein
MHNLTILDLTEIEFALLERIARLQVVADAPYTLPDDAVFVLLERSRAALDKVRAAL